MSSRALVVVEGENREVDFFERMRDVLSWNLSIVPFCGNVSMLFDAMLNDGFNSDVIALLRSQTSDPDKLKILSDTYTDIYYVLDLDPQHNLKCLPGETNDDALRRNANQIVARALQMAQILNQSTDPTVGQLLINFPSIESYRDADDFFDAGYADKTVCLGELCRSAPFNGRGYKSLSTRGKLASRRINSFSECNFADLAVMNAFKLVRMNTGVWGSVSYDVFRTHSDQGLILTLQNQFMQHDLKLWVLNTSLFIMFDYKGRSYYEALCANHEKILGCP